MVVVGIQAALVGNSTWYRCCDGCFDVFFGDEVNAWTTYLVLPVFLFLSVPNFNHYWNPPSNHPTQFQLEVPLDETTNKHKDSTK